MRKVVYNACYGGFGLSNKAKELAYEKTGDKRWLDEYNYKEDERHNRTLVEVVEILGSKEASGRFAKLMIAQVDEPYRIDEYDGFESVETPSSYEWS